MKRRNFMLGIYNTEYINGRFVDLYMDQGVHIFMQHKYYGADTRKWFALSIKFTTARQKPINDACCFVNRHKEQ